jgi:pimeloyl-ACP methyl ester carboxylesterase
MAAAGHPGGRSRIVRRLLAALAIASVSATGCTMLQRVLGFERQLARAGQIARIEGRVETEAPSEGPLVVVLGRVVEGEPLVGVDSFIRVRPGSYAFPVAPGRYQVGAYEDRNRNGLLDPGERTALVSEAPVLEVGLGEEASHDVWLAEDATTPPTLTEPINVLDLVARTPREQEQFSLWAWSAVGEICPDLQDPAFGAESGQRGLWEIVDFLNEGLAGIYFLEPFDPDRVPVLFVHGMSGHPQEFTALIDSLDRTRFQPWFLFYPSGFGLHGIARYAATLLERLHVEHDFDELAIVAHSMGGLVARGAILEYARETDRDDVRLLVTLSTPWGGSESAARSANSRVELPPAIADMRPTSDFLRWLFYQDEQATEPRRLPEQVEFHMLFGFRMNGSSSQANDGSVTVASQARLEAQEQAASVRAFDRRHVEILGSEEPVTRVNQLLAERF